jgi:hypothetical protein
MSVEAQFGWDSETDVGALVYGEGDDPDVLLRLFARRRAAQGRRVVGLIQHRIPGTWGRRRDAGFQRLAPDAVLASEFEITGPNLRNYDPIDEVAAALETDLARGPDVLIVNRFGRLECRGQGMFPLLVRTSLAGIPALVPVPADHFDRWLEMGGGLAVRLPPNSFALEHWWRSVAPGGAINSECGSANEPAS